MEEEQKRRGRPSKNAKAFHFTLPVELKEWADQHTEGRVVDGKKDSTSWLIQRLMTEYREKVEAEAEAAAAMEALAEKRAQGNQ